MGSFWARTSLRQGQNSKKNFKIGRRIVHVLWNMQNVFISRSCFLAFCKQRQRNEQLIIRHAYTAIALVAVAVAVKVWLTP